MEAKKQKQFHFTVFLWERGYASQIPFPVVFLIKKIKKKNTLASFSPFFIAIFILFGRVEMPLQWSSESALLLGDVFLLDELGTEVNVGRNPESNEKVP